MASASIPAPPSRNWLELPPELTASIFHRVGAIDVLMNARKVCRTWRQLCSDPEMWRVVDLRYTGDLCDIDLRKMARKALEMSAGHLVDLTVRHFADDELLNFIADRSSQLRRVSLISCFSITSDGLSEMVKKLPLLEDLHLYRIHVSKQAIEVAGKHCTQLKSFKLNSQDYGYSNIGCDEEAVAIAENMHGLRHLQLFGNKITTDGLLAILEKCPHLESLDLRRCLNVANLEPDLLKRLSQQMKDLRLTYDSLEDFDLIDEIDDKFDDLDSFDDGNASGFSDIDLVSDDYDYVDEDDDVDDNDDDDDDEDDGGGSDEMYYV
ncbi:hypothetical protein DCAR_0415485 [Daucus carota subsp. sativus]|uniref:F-box domain-containing protein n=1 Tax=Daucus carota subsp. sativus TaxID=79200 RepID=A0A165WAY6_DAUCS|nr:PREDICTED: putative F-box/LRR-repeat protein 9 [Daucus carota subsp. sativus]XP_017248501.1 PREDICTED: putative F-box/LRR-repeat protein 9 [Daucus carota subsp. sativus]XP_017248502.1 PREDICTED: putative F-box/LRR-repeat protein 9 [Daucus carota subsp. sativus]XP_017248503.1 PREDICTED: putative F-box/LRR-repeat protein 9 [Daucus carota subsp. sativus]WOG96154.1 hypothetical protein DCAR_0415485 [Daucus carota subsp. sativus]